MLLFPGGLLDEGIEAGFLAGGGVLLECSLRDRFVDRLLSPFEEVCGGIDLAVGHRFTGGLDSALEHTFDDLVLSRLVLGHAHVLLGILFDRHIRCLDDEKTTRKRSPLLYHGFGILASHDVFE